MTSTKENAKQEDANDSNGKKRHLDNSNDQYSDADDKSNNKKAKVANENQEEPPSPTPTVAYDEEGNPLEQNGILKEENINLAQELAKRDKLIAELFECMGIFAKENKMLSDLRESQEKELKALAEQQKDRADLLQGQLGKIQKQNEELIEQIVILNGIIHHKDNPYMPEKKSRSP